MKYENDINNKSWWCEHIWKFDFLVGGKTLPEWMTWRLILNLIDVKTTNILVQFQILCYNRIKSFDNLYQKVHFLDPENNLMKGLMIVSYNFNGLAL